MTDKLKELYDTLEAAATLRRERKISFFEPYEKQLLFFEAGLTKRERLLQAGNQLGKTTAGAAEMTYHLTGDYPDWWLGRRFDKPVRAWICGETSQVVRDVQQKMLCGEPGVENSLGTGMIPKASFADKPSMSRGITDAFDTIQVRHKSGGISVAKFKSYEQGREKFQGDTVDVIWDDEEPDLAIYSECLTRITASRGMIYITFTPLKGMSEVVARFHNEKSEDRFAVVMTIYDAKHIAESERQSIIAGYPSHEREARAMGIPMMGSGRIFAYSDDSISEEPLTYVPAHWGKLWGVDFGIGHNFGAVLALVDRDNDVIHIHHTLRLGDQLPINHAAAMKVIGAAVPVAWPHDGHARDKGSGDTLASLYKKQGLIMLGEHATFSDGGISTEAAVLEMQDRMTTGRLKVARHLADWFEEFRLYHRKDGQIVKIRDDLMSATQKIIMARRHARLVALGGKVSKRRVDAVADGLDFDIFGGY